METPAGIVTTVESNTRARARGVSWLDLLTVFAILLVVTLVTIPRLRRFALRENELDAMRMLRTLASRPAPSGLAHGATMDLALCVNSDRALARRLEDLTIDGDGFVARHGYLFDMAILRPGEPMLRAWPAVHGETGLGAFVWTPQRGLLGIENADGRFSGPGGAPRPADVGAGWLRLTERL